MMSRKTMFELIVIGGSALYGAFWGFWAEDTTIVLAGAAFGLFAGAWAVSGKA